MRLQIKQILISSFFFSAVVYGNELDPAVQKDFFIICEASKFANALKKNPFFHEPAERAYLVEKMQESLVSTPIAKKALQAISEADPADKSKLLKAAAKDAGIKKWNCPTMEDLFR